MGQGSERAVLVACGLSLTQIPGEPHILPLGRPRVRQVSGADKGCPALWPVPSSQPLASRAAMAQGPPPCAQIPHLLALAALSGSPRAPPSSSVPHPPPAWQLPVHVCRPSNATCMWGWVKKLCPGCPRALTCIAGTRVVIGVHASFVAAADGGPGFLAAGTSLMREEEM